MASELALVEDEAETSLVGSLVEIGSGERGRVLGWNQDQGTYVVHTFTGQIVNIPQDKVTAFEPPEAEADGGFDVAWPSLVGAGPDSAAERIEQFAAEVADKIADQGFCLVQMFEGEAAATEVAEVSRDIFQWGKLQEDTEEDYLGEMPVEGKCAWTQYSTAGDGMKLPGLRTYEMEQLGASLDTDNLTPIERVDQALTNLPALVSTYTTQFEDEKAFVAWGRTSALVRASFDELDDRKVVNRSYLGTDDAQELEEHVAFVDAKKLCVMFWVQNEGGEMVLTPAPEAYDYTEVSLPLTRNKMLIFRCDALGMNFSYRPEGTHLSMTSWVLDVPSRIREREESLRIIDGPAEPEGRINNVMSVMTRYPGSSFEPLAYWSMLASGSDTQIYVPVTRWDPDIYYRKEHTIGFSMTCHGAMLQHSEVTSFDNKFFGIPSEESETMAPYMRVMLEVGYEALHRAGHRRDEMNGWHCGVFVGDSGSDWDTSVEPLLTAKNLKWRFAGRERSSACARLSHIFGLKGPVSTAETACSSSLVAAGIAKMNMRKREEGQKNPSISTDLDHGLVIGSNTLIGPGSYISLSGPGMLTSHGRCFTFDQSADGFARGEGIGAVKLKVCKDSSEAIDRIAALIGCCVNQDGRSASMTAPHGPSQQSVIKESMREGGLSPKQITIAECHGTGTALGDPIEVGALRGVLGTSRVAPILKTSAKTNIGHLEAAAGIAGLIKCICMLNYASGAPNCHLLTLNPHLDVAGFPVYFQTEAMDFGANSGLTGVSSFGFGGTNARADVWGHAQHGARYSITGYSLKPISITF